MDVKENKFLTYCQVSDITTMKVLELIKWLPTQCTQFPTEANSDGISIIGKVYFNFHLEDESEIGTL